MKNKPFYFRRIVTTIIDLSLIYCISLLLQPIIYKVDFEKNIDIFIFVFLLYYSLSYSFLNGRTPAKILTSLKIIKQNNTHFPLKNIIAREIILKGIFGLIIPTYFIEKIFSVWSSLFTLILFTIILISSLLFLFIFKRPWWEQLSQTVTIKTNITRKKDLKYAFLFITLILTNSIIKTVYPFIFGKEELKNSLSPSYPVNKKTAIYSDFIKTHSQKPEDYIFDLFKTNDIIVISERMHPEYSQYEMIFNLISDDRFTKYIGNIFTECGSVSFQDTLKSYLNTHFTSNEQLNINTSNLDRNSNAVWPLWSNTNQYDFFETVNKLNFSLPDSTKINWYFTDLPVNWETKSHKQFIKDYTNPQRDSFMASSIIEKYNNIISKEKRKKALVIMNTRHGYGLIDNRFGKRIKSEYYGTTAFLMNAFPKKVANIMLNTVSLKYGFLFTPVQNGKWETAFSIVDNPNVGFNFNGSPFGDDKFDLAFLSAPNLTYKDVFTGFIFYNPLRKHFQKDGFPNEFENFEDTILRRSALVSQSHLNTIKSEIAYQKLYPKEPIFSESLKYGYLYNLIRVILIPLILLIIFFVSAIIFLNAYRRI